jgi:hypothetical protein
MNYRIFVRNYQRASMNELILCCFHWLIFGEFSLRRRGRSILRYTLIKNQLELDIWYPPCGLPDPRSEINTPLVRIDQCSDLNQLYTNLKSKVRTKVHPLCHRFLVYYEHDIIIACLRVKQA